MIKVIGQLLFALAITQIMPADAAVLEHLAGVPESAYPGIDFDLSGSVSEFPLAADRIVYPVKIDPSSYGIVTTAQSALVVDASSGMILLAKHPDQVRSVGSVTKLMSALVFLETEPDLAQTVTLDAESDLVYGGRIYLDFDTEIVLEDILAASLVGSDNTATQSLVRFSGLESEEFLDRMNAKALELGMTETHFADPTGIDAGNISTARDLAILLEAAAQNELIGFYTTLTKINITQGNGLTVTIENTNGLLEGYLNLGDNEIVAGKTGYLPQAGYVLVSAVEEGGHRLDVIVMGAESKEAREQEVKGLATWAFRVFEWPS